MKHAQPLFKTTLLTLLFGVLLSCSSLVAQMNYSVRLGVNGCIEKQPSSLLPKYQITSGITARLPIGKHSRISLSLNYARKAFQYFELDTQNFSFYRTTYVNISKTSIEIPLLYEFHFKNGLFIGVGPFADLTASFLYEGYTNMERSPIIQEHFVSKKTNHLFDGGASVAFGMIAKNGVGIQLLYTSGWHQFMAFTYYDTYLDLYFKNLAFTVSYTFSHLKKSEPDEN